MKKIRSILTNSKFRTRLLASYILIALLPLVIFAAVVSVVFISRTQNTAISHTAQMVRRVSTSMDVYIQSIDKIANYICLMQSEQVDLDIVLRDIFISHPEIAGIMIAFEDENCVGIGMYRISRDSLRNEEWYVSAIEARGKITLAPQNLGRNIVTNDGYSADEVFSLSKAIIDPKTKDTLGVILFDLKHDIIMESISSITIGENGFIFVTDATDEPIYTPANDVVLRVNPSWLSNSDTTFAAMIRGSQYQIYRESSQYTGWKTIGVFPLSEVMGSVNSIFLILIIAMAVLLIFILIAAPPLSNSVTHLVSEINKLMKRDTEMKILQEQIKPHFLYNTLDTISWLARDCGANDIVKLVDALTSMFRIGLSQGSDVISIGDEISHVSNYLYIQEIRYKSKLNYIIDVDENILQIKIPKLILQPLVENAIYHGIKQKRSGGTVHIIGKMHDGTITFTVHDDGVGMSQEQIADIISMLMDENSQHTKSFGLFYVKERLRLYYNDEYEFNVVSEAGMGTSVKVQLPCGKEM